MDQRGKRTIKKPKRFQTTTSEDASTKRYKGHAKLTQKHKDAIGQDIIQLRNILDDENNSESGTDDYTSTSEDGINDRSKSAQRTFEKNVSKQSDQLLPELNYGHMNQCTTTNTVPAPVKISDQSTPNQTATNNTLHCTSPNSTSQHIQYCPSSTQMLYRQENIPNNHYPLQSSCTEMPCNQGNISNNCPPPTQVPHTYQNIPNNQSQYAVPNNNNQPQYAVPNNINQPQYAENIPLWPQLNNAAPNAINNAVPKAISNINEDRPVLQPIDYNKLQERLGNMDALLHRILNAVQSMVRTQKLKRPIPKPAVLPITSMEEMATFNDIGEDTYVEVVRYFKFLGGFHIKEVVNTCLKEAIADAVTPHFTWWGNERKQAFSKSRLVHAIYEAACDNAHFQSPCRLDFQKHMKEALRTCQERYRSRNRNRQQAVENNRNNRDYWNNNGSNTNTVTPETSTDE